MNIQLDCVMLIDDDEEDNYFHRLVLEESFSVNNIKIAESGFEALKYLRSGKQIPEIIFLDVNMPKMNGWEFVEEYKKIEVKQDPKPIIIMLTTSINPADKTKAEYSSIINGFENKPLTEETIKKILHQHFKEKQ